MTLTAGGPPSPEFDTTLSSCRAALLCRSLRPTAVGGLQLQLFVRSTGSAPNASHGALRAATHSTQGGYGSRPAPQAPPLRPTLTHSDRTQATLSLTAQAYAYTAGTLPHSHPSHHPASTHSHRLPRSDQAHKHIDHTTRDDTQNKERDRPARTVRIVVEALTHPGARSERKNVCESPFSLRPPARTFARAGPSRRARVSRIAAGLVLPARRLVRALVAARLRGGLGAFPLPAVLR